MPDRIDRYEIIEELGRGGMASVFYAKDPRFGRHVAIKLIAEDQSKNEGLRQRFEREARTIAALEHPAIVPVYDFGEFEGRLYLVKRHMPGGSLAERADKSRVSLIEVYDLMLRLAPAVDYAHSQGVIHRDLKPGNILFDQHGKAYLADFGIARLAAEGVPTLTQGVIGTPTYMSPEQARGDKDIDGRSDVYSIGAMVFALLNGSPPFKSTTPMGMALAHLNEPPPLLSKTSPQLPVGLDPVLTKVLAKERAERYPTCSAFVATLRPFAEVTTAPTLGNGFQTIIEPQAPDPGTGATDSSPGQPIQPPSSQPVSQPVPQTSTPAGAPTVMDSSPAIQPPKNVVRAAPPAPVPAASPEPTPKRSSKGLLIGGIGVVVLCVLAVAGAAATGVFSSEATPTPEPQIAAVEPTETALPTATETETPTDLPATATIIPTTTLEPTPRGPPSCWRTILVCSGWCPQAHSSWAVKPAARKPWFIRYCSRTFISTKNWSPTRTMLIF